VNSCPDNKRHIAIGCGALTPLFIFIEEFKADLAVCSDDGFTYGRDGAFAIDTEFPVVIANHPVSEEYGFKLMAEHPVKAFPQVPVHHIPQRCMYRTISAPA
jgi:hypothetical protein